MKLDEEKMLNISGVKSFDPIRIILKSSDKKFNEVIRDKSFLIEPLFMINEMFPIGMDDFKYSLGKTSALLDTIQVTISLIVQNCENERFINLLEDIRISLQNFLYLLNLKSFYTSFSELRKTLEGVLWIILIHEDENNLNNEKINEVNNYSDLFKKYVPELLGLWRLLSKTTHSKNKSMIFNINIYYKTKDFVNEIILELQKCSQIIYDKLNLIISIFDEQKYKVLKRYKKLLNKLWSEREKYNLIDFPPVNHLHYFPPKLQSLLEKNIKNKGIDESDYCSLINNYIIGMENSENYILEIKTTNYNKLILQERHIKDSIKYISKKLISKSTIMPIIHSEDFILEILRSTFDDEKIFTENNAVLSNLWIKQLKSFAIVLYGIEIKMGGSLNIAILKSLIEELMFNLIAGKLECYLFLNFFVEFGKNAFKQKIKINSNFIKYRHLQISDRILYKSIHDGEETGVVSGTKESMDIILELIENIIDEQLSYVEKMAEK